MPLDFQVAPVTFTKGLDTHSQRKMVVPGKWDTLINVSHSADGTLKRRDGFEALIDGQAGNGLARRNDELLVINKSAVSTISESTTPATARQAVGKLPFFDVSKSEVDFTQGFHDSMDCASSGSLTCYVWRDLSTSMTLNGIYCSIIDEASGARVLSRSVLSNTVGVAGPRVVYADGAFFCFYVEPASILICNVIAVSAPTVVGVPTNIVSSASLAAENYDACAFGSAAAVAYRWLDGTTSVRALTVTRSGTTPSLALGPTNAISEANVNETSISALAIAPYSGNANIGVFVVHIAGGALAAGCVGAVMSSAALAVSTAAALIDTTVPASGNDTHVTATSSSSTAMQVFWDQQGSYTAGAATIQPIRTTVVSATLAATVAAYTVLRSACFDINGARASGPCGPFIAGKAFTYNSGSYLPVCMLENFAKISLGANTNTASAQCSLFLLDCSSTSAQGVVVGGALYQTYGLVDLTLGGGPPIVSTPCSTPLINSGYAIAAPERGRLSLVSGFNFTPVGISRVTFTPRDSTPGLDVQLAENTYFAGGQLGNYDGQSITQHAFPMFPEGIHCLRVATGGAAGKLTVGVHQIVAVYEWTDGAGNRVQSAPSLPVTVTVVVDSDTITVIVPTTQLAQQCGYNLSFSTLTIALYMTAAGGLSFYRVTPDLVGAAPVNVTTTSTITITVGAPVIPDSRLTTNELLYTQPNQAGTTLPNMPPGPMHGIGVSQNRVWGFVSDEPLEYTFSQEPLPNTGLQFNPDALGGILPAVSGGGVAIAALDEKTILFARDKLYAVYGNGPNAAGGFNGFSEPQEIPSDVGCSEARSIVSTPKGIFFKSAKGWYLLGRDLSVGYVGEGVARWDSASVTSAVMIANRQEIRITSESTSIPTLVYSYEVDAWSTYYMGNIIHPGAITDSMWWPATEEWVHLHPSSTIFPGLMQDTTGSYTDGAGTSSPVGFFIYGRTGWLHLGALEGFQRVRRAYLTGTTFAAPTTSLTMLFDFDDAYDTAGMGSYSVVTDLSTITFGSVESIDLRHRLTKQKCKSIAFSFLEGSANVSKIPITGFQALSLEVGLKKGVNRLPSTQTVG